MFKHCSIKATLFIAAFLSLNVIGTAQQTTYFFRSVKFDSYEITGSITLAKPLPPNINLPVGTIDEADSLTPISFSFTNGAHTLTNRNSAYSGFSVNTDKNGNIVQWDFYAEDGVSFYIYSNYFPDTDSQVGFNYGLDQSVDFDADGVPTGIWCKGSISSCPTIVMSVNGAKDQSTEATATIAANLALGSDFQVGLQDEAGNPIPATFSSSKTLVSGTLDPSAIFPRNVVFQYSTSLPNRAWFQSAHNGTATLTITPTMPMFSPISLDLTIGNPASLGTVHPEVDNLIFPLANKTGIPPQFVKAQMAQESSNLFDPKAFRYEPLAPFVGDYGVVSRNQDFRANLFSKYRFATASDSLDKALLQGSLVDGDDLLISDHFLACCGTNPSALDIVTELDSTQHWTTQGRKAKSNYNDLLDDDFTPQTSLASSYGYLQVTYVTAITKLKWLGVSGFQNPSLLYDTPANSAGGGGSLPLGCRYIQHAFAQLNPAEASNPDMQFQDPSDLVSAFYAPWQAYNGSSKYPPKVAVRIPSYPPVAVGSVF